MSTWVALEKFQKTVEKTTCGIAAGIILFMVFPVSIDVILRYLFRSPIPQVYDLSEFMIVGATYLAIAYVQTIKGHIKIEAATARLSEKWKAGLDIFGYGLGAGLFAVITWQSAALAWEAWVTQDHTMGVINLPLWPAKSIVPIGTGLLCLRLVSDILLEIGKLRGIVHAHHSMKEVEK
jgi:TRAP-type C4-dicarboxylate transport system permease small subunit